MNHIISIKIPSHRNIKPSTYTSRLRSIAIITNSGLIKPDHYSLLTYLPSLDPDDWFDENKHCTLFSSTKREGSFHSPNAIRKWGSKSVNCIFNM